MTEVEAALWGASIGAAAGIASNFITAGFTLYQKKQEDTRLRDSVRASIAAEVEVLIQLLERNEYFEALESVMDQEDGLAYVTEVSFFYLPMQSSFSKVYNANLANISELGSMAGLAIEVYAHIESAVETSAKIKDLETEYLRMPHGTVGGIDQRHEGLHADLIVIRDKGAMLVRGLRNNSAAARVNSTNVGDQV